MGKSLVGQFIKPQRINTEQLRLVEEHAHFHRVPLAAN